VAPLQFLERTTVSNDLLKRASQLLNGRNAGTPSPLPSQGNGSAIIARAEAALGGSIRRAMPAASEPRVERVRLPMTCSARGVAYTVIAERNGDVLRFLGHEMPQNGRGADNAPRMPSHLSGQYRIDWTQWACPLCSTAKGVWLCDCHQMEGAMHCMGTSGGRQHCACGRLEQHEFVTVEKIAVRGSSMASAPKTAGAADATRSSSSTRRLTNG
jgi:hypothetical protein